MTGLPSADARAAGRESDGPRVYFETRLDRQAGRRIFHVSLVFAVPSALAAVAVLGDALARPAFSPAHLLAGLLLLAFALIAGQASRTAWRAIGSRLWLVEEGLLLEAPERLLPLSRGATPERLWKKSAGRALRLRGESAGPAFLFVPGLALKTGDQITLYAPLLGDALEPLEAAFGARASDHGAGAYGAAIAPNE